jgi:Fe-S cluster assembly iron-binding protein IscA
LSSLFSSSVVAQNELEVQHSNTMWRQAAGSVRLRIFMTSATHKGCGGLEYGLASHDNMMHTDQSLD